MTMTTQDPGSARLDTGAKDDTAVPDPEVPERTRSPRRFSASYKARILAEYASLKTKADKGALLRREGLYSSLLAELGFPRQTGQPSRSVLVAPRLLELHR